MALEIPLRMLLKNEAVGFAMLGSIAVVFKELST